MTTPVARYYTQIPRDQYWNTGFSNFVIEAESIDLKDPYLLNRFKAYGAKECEKKIKAFAEEMLKVMSPKDYPKKYIAKAILIECPGPMRELRYKEHMGLFHSLNPYYPLPKNWSLKTKTQIGQDKFEYFFLYESPYALDEYHYEFERTPLHPESEKKEPVRIDITRFKK